LCYCGIIDDEGEGIKLVDGDSEGIKLVDADSEGIKLVDGDSEGIKLVDADNDGIKLVDGEGIKLVDADSEGGITLVEGVGSVDVDGGLHIFLKILVKSILITVFLHPLPQLPEPGHVLAIGEGDAEGCTGKDEVDGDGSKEWVTAHEDDAEGCTGKDEDDAEGCTGKDDDDKEISGEGSRVSFNAWLGDTSGEGSRVSFKLGSSEVDKDSFEPAAGYTVTTIRISGLRVSKKKNVPTSSKVPETTPSIIGPSLNSPSGSKPESAEVTVWFSPRGVLSQTHVIVSPW